MRFTIERGDFLAPLQRIQGIVGTRTSMPILANCLVEAGSAGIEVVATNLEIGVRDRTACAVAEPGRVCVAGRKLYELVKAFPEGAPVEVMTEGAPVEVTTEGARLKLRSGRITAHLLGMEPAEFPVLPEIPAGNGMTLAAATLGELLAQTFFAMSTDITRQTLGGVLFAHDGEGHLEVVATDGHRLACRRLAVAGVTAFREIVPRKAVAEIRRLVEEGDGEVNLTFGDKHAVLRRADLTLITRLIEGRYPEYQRAIPATCRNLVVVDREALTTACRRVAIFANEKTNQVELEVSADSLVIVAQNPELGDAREEIEAKLEGDGVRIAFNARYLLDILGGMAGASVRMEMNDGNSPSLFTSGEAADYRCVLMPMRL